VNTNLSKAWRRWLVSLIVAGLVVGGGYLVVSHTILSAQGGSSEAANSAGSAQATTVAIQPATVAQTAVSAAGNLTLVDERSVALGVGGVVEEIAVSVGDVVRAGNVLLRLNTVELEREAAQARLAVEAARLALADLQTPASASELAVARAALAEAQENLAAVQAGASDEEIAAARSSLAAAQASYSELQAGPGEAELAQLSAELKKAEVALAEAQRAYDQVAWRNEAGMTAEAADLQAATIDYEAAKAAYAQSTAGATSSELQSAVSAIQEAQVQLNQLLNSPTAAEFATAQAQVAEAEAALDELQRGPTDNEVRSAEITLQEALIALEAAYRNLEAATVVAPMDGVVLSVDAKEGVRSAADTVVVVLADPAQLELVVNVAEADIARVALGQQAQIEVDALPGQAFDGAVAAIVPASDSDAASVVYPVTIRLTDDSLEGVLPGMNAVATLASATTPGADSWLVPTNALVETGGLTTVTVVRGGAQIVVTVTPGAVQGEWTVVQSAGLQAGDQVVGTLTSGLDNNNGGFPGGPPGGVAPLGG
jgi:HlyD family secretion protein